jgi:peroxiredoxin
MTIKVGDKIPDVQITTMTDKGPGPVKTGDFFKGRTVALFAVPGAFTPTCSAKHLPGYVDQAEAIRGKGVDVIACMAVNDAFVMGAWGKAQNVGDKVTMLADGNGAFTRELGLEMDGSKFGMGSRSQRFSMLVKDGVVKQLNVEAPGAFEVSDAGTMLKQLS